jgi:Uma2 family endonuclease
MRQWYGEDMSTATLIPVEEYLNTSYDPDVEYVDGVLVERNVGDYLHSLIQSNIIFALRRKYPHLRVLPELRSRTRETRYRLPDVCVLLAPPNTRYLVDAAHIAIEILSDDDRMSKMLEKLEEYAAKGVPNIWLIDPRLERISVYVDGSLELVKGDTISTSDGIELTRDDIFQQ